MIQIRSERSYSWLMVAVGAAVLGLSACNKDNPGTGGGGGTGGSGGGGGGSGGGGGGGGSGGGGGGPMPPPPDCQAAPEDATDAENLTFPENLIASPAPPGALTLDKTPQIVVFGFDDVENEPGIDFVNSLIGSVTNPDSKKGALTLNPNACYVQGWADASKYACGDGSISLVRSKVTQSSPDIGNHTVDHLESNSGWTGIPAQYKSTDPSLPGWKFSDDGFGPGIVMDQQTWVTVLKADDTAIKGLLTISGLNGFRAPRLEVNDNGLQAVKQVGYTYDETLEEILPDEWVTAAIGLDTAGKQGFNWMPWPYTLDNGSPGIWNQQTSNDKKYIQNFPNGLWELPVYQMYVPAAGSTGKDIADAMMACDKDCTFPDWVPVDQRTHCFLAEGELSPGDTVKEVSAFDFNTFVYSRMTKDQWLTSMKHTFLMRFYGNRAPLTYGAHPIEYTDPYDSYTLAVQGNNYGYRNVLKYNKYPDRQAAMKEFVQWIKGNPDYAKATFFLSGKQLVDFMKKPFDVTGKPVDTDAVASPDSNALFKGPGWQTDGADVAVTDGNSATITFNVQVADEPVSATAGIKVGALAKASHIDIKYNTQVPFRIRLLTEGGGFSTTVLLAGVGGDRTARIRVKDFFPGPEASAAQVTGNGLVNGDYMAKVAGIQFESAATEVTGAKSFKTDIKQITLHGVNSADLCGK